MTDAPSSTAIPGLVTLASQRPVKATIDRLAALAGERGILVFARIDHAAAAQSAGLSMRNAEVLILGNPKAGTPWMQELPTIAIDLPLKALAWEDFDGRAMLSFNDPVWLAERHHASEAILNAARQMRAGLLQLAEAAAK